LPLGSFEAYLFDCDGTIADSMPLHYIAWKKALAEWNCTFDEQLFYTLGGTPVAEIVSLLNKNRGSTCRSRVCPLEKKTSTWSFSRN
jgi:beta-phosphoglucomutase-like phosphatase (HAD superfamily)